MRSIWTRPLTPFELALAIVIVAVVFWGLAFLAGPPESLRERARLATCLSNCKQLASAFEMYGQDYDGTYPYQGPGLGNDVSDFSKPGASTNWIVAVLPYTKNERIFVCPAVGSNVPSTAASGSASAQPKQCSYLINGCFNGMRKSAIDRPAEKVMAFCWPYSTGNALLRPGNQVPHWRPVAAEGSRGWANHRTREGTLGRSCFMGDGHARFLPEAKLTRAHFAVGPYAARVLPAQP
jgi:hypothetical protein